MSNFDINPGSLNKKIEVFEENIVPNNSGGYEDDLILICHIWASIKSLFGKELWEAQKINADVTHEIIIRSRNDIKKSQIIKYKNKTFDILYFLSANDKETYLKVRVKERL